MPHFILLAQMALDWTTVMPFTLFGAFAAGALWLLELFGTGRPRAEQRLDEIRDPSLRKRGDAPQAQSTAEAMTRVLESASPTLAQPLMPKDAAEASDLKSRLSYAGFRGENASTVFLGLKFASLLVGLLIGGGVSVFLTGFDFTALLRAGIVAGAFFYLPEGVLWYLIKLRTDEIFYGLPDALDLLVVCVEAGLGLDHAMRKVSEELKKSHAVVCEEFALCNFHLQMGRSRSEVLQDLGARTGVEDLRSLSSILIQADRFGSSVAQALRVQSDAMRTRRRQMAEEQAAKTAVKLIFPLVLFIFPGIFVVLVGPAAITMVNQLFPAMGG